MMLYLYVTDSSETLVIKLVLHRELYDTFMATY